VKIKIIAGISGAGAVAFTWCHMGIAPPVHSTVLTFKKIIRRKESGFIAVK
jgi:hypothetical protein